MWIGKDDTDMMRKIKNILLLVILLVVFANRTLAEEPRQIIVNSEDWRDVYSVMIYGGLADKTTNFLVSNKHATLILGGIAPSTHIWAITSKTVPYVAGYKAILESKGYSAEEFIYDSVNLEFAKKTNTENFIIVDDSYGYNAISVAPYAVISKSYVLFADRGNINEIVRFFEGRNIKKLIVYGNVDRQVRDALARFNPEIINKDGDRFLNNIEILKRYQEIKHSKQAILTNGEFIEKEIMSGTEPVVFIGTNNVPDVVREYIKSSDIEIGVLIGNELVGTATFVRRQLGISVFVKFAQGARSPKGAISQVEALDMFYLPTYRLNLELESVRYNRATNQLEVTIRNTEEQASYFLGTYTLTGNSGEKQTVGDIGANFIDSKELKTVVYDTEQITDGDTNVDAFIIYGESKGSLEKEIRKTVTAQSVRILDECNIKVNDIFFNKRNQIVYTEVENTGNVPCFIDMELIDVVVAGEKKTYGLENIANIDSGRKLELKVKTGMAKDDIDNNQKIKIRAYYGERENSLVKVIEGSYELAIKEIDYVFYSLLTVIMLLVVIIIWKRKKRKVV